MLQRSSIRAVVIAAALGAIIIGAQAHDESQFPDLKGQWVADGANPNAYLRIVESRATISRFRVHAQARVPE